MRESGKYYRAIRNSEHVVVQAEKVFDEDEMNFYLCGSEEIFVEHEFEWISKVPMDAVEPSKEAGSTVADIANLYEENFHCMPDSEQKASPSADPLSLFSEMTKKAKAAISHERPLQDLMDAWANWSNATFGKEQRTIPIIYHLAKEIEELKFAIFHEHGKEEILEEIVDCLALLLDAASHEGITANVLMDAYAAKLEINKSRTWGKPDENGVVEHVKEGE